MKSEALFKTAGLFKFLLILPAFLWLAYPAQAGDGIEVKSLMGYEVTQKGPDKNLKKTEAIYELVFVERSGKVVTGPIRYSYNNITRSTKGNAAGKLSLKVKPGKYKFQFWYNANHAEVYTDSIEIKPANRTQVKVFFDRMDVIMTADKPVIYLYPEKTTEVNVQLAIKGNFLFTYPMYTENGWKVTAQPDGTLQQDGKTYNYLFWEGETQVPVNLNTNEGFVCSTTELTGFFEEKLAHLGLNSREIQDYITYWVPRMQQHPKHYIRFVLNQEYNQVATLNVSPQPDHFIRVFMVWSPLEKNQELTVKEQTLPTFERVGFTLVEWGGTQINDLSVFQPLSSK